jgi:hypothetical protein
MRSIIGKAALLASAGVLFGCVDLTDDELSLQAEAVSGIVAVDPPREPTWWSVVFHEEAVIAADPALIWDLLIDLPGYQDWNPWITWAEGETVPGATVHVDVVLGGNVQRVEHVILVVETEQRFCWKDGGWTPLFVYGQRCRTLTLQPDGRVKVENDLLLDGLVPHLAKLFLGAQLQAGMAAETAALKQTAEAGS